MLVHHFAEAEKVARLREKGLAAVEIDLSSSKEWTWETLTTAVVDTETNRKWLFNPRMEALRTEAQKEANERARQADRNDSERSASIALSLAHQRASLQGVTAACDALAEFIRPERLAAERKRMAETGQEEGAWQSASGILDSEWDTAPSFANVEVRGGKK